MWGIVAFVISFVVAATIIAAIWGWKVVRRDLEDAFRIAFDDLRF